MNDMTTTLKNLYTLADLVQLDDVAHAPVDVAHKIKHAADLMRRDRTGEARSLLLALAFVTRRYAVVLHAHDEPTRGRAFDATATHYRLALAVAHDKAGWLPEDKRTENATAYPEAPVDEPRAGSGRLVAEHVSAKSYTSAQSWGNGIVSVFARAQYHHPTGWVRAHPTEPIGVEVCIDLPDPMRTQVAFNMLVHSPTAARALVRHWATIGHALGDAATTALEQL